MRRFLLILVAGSVLPALSFGDAQPYGAPPHTVVIEHCTVSPLAIDGEVQVPAQEAGVLTAIKVRPMEEVKAGMLLAQIDDVVAQKQYQNATAEYKAAKQKSETDIDFQVADKAAGAAWFEWQKNLEAVNGIPDKPGVPGRKPVPGAVSATELKHLEFQWQRADLAKVQAKNDQIVNGFTAEAKLAEAEIAREQIIRREVRAPIDGVVQKIVPTLGEWVKPGDPVMRIVRMDRLRVDGYLELEKLDPVDVIDREVTVKVTLAGGKEFTFRGKIVYVDVEVQGEHEFQVTAEIKNEKVNGRWLLRPGVPAKMEIQLQ